MDDTTKDLINNILNALDAALADQSMGYAMITESSLQKRIEGEMEATRQARTIIMQEVKKIWPRVQTIIF